MTLRVRPFLEAAALVGALGLVGPLSSPASGQIPFRIDHFKCYYTSPSPINETVQLRDQFDRLAGPNVIQDALVWRAIRFCNPVEKTVRRSDGTTIVTPIRNKESHLTIYRMFPYDRDLAPTRKVVIENQFGTRTLRTFGPEALAVPTQKNNEGRPHDLDHFKCYRAYGSTLNRTVTLRDQFRVDERMRVLYPFALCNPTEKFHGTSVTPVTNPEDHLVCYKITLRPFDLPVLATNQFGLDDLRLQTADLLCVPSKKLSVSQP